MVFKRILVILFSLLPFLAIAETSKKQAKVDYNEKISVEILMQTSKDILGKELSYAKGKPQITSAIVSIPVDSESGWHVHDNPLVAYVLEGELTVDYGSKGKKVIKAGEVFNEAVVWPHNGKNTGKVPTKLVVFFLGNNKELNTRQVDKAK